MQLKIEIKINNLLLKKKISFKKVFYNKYCELFFVFKLIIQFSKSLILT